MKCCTFDVFLTGFMAAAHRHKIPLVCVNKMRARRDWRSGMTGNEALLTQRTALLKEAEYIYLTQLDGDRGSHERA